ncbi:hypothetical protein BJY04DRAFT_225120, partial [Aspergillus karnatakaensis]|uniref:uncharacterized protein n=1 Tax=Aspergillus karnatakaensis TaxID=1810916 RepID=UPI003CCD28FF
YPPPRNISSSRHRAPQAAASPTRRSRVKNGKQAGRETTSTLPSPSASANDSSTTATPYSQNFEQNLSDHQVYLPRRQIRDRNSGGNGNDKADNLSTIRRRLEAPRRSLDPTTFPKTAYGQFTDAHWAATKEADITASAFPYIEGNPTTNSLQQYASRDTRFTNLAPLTDGTISQAKPDITYGARPEQLDGEIRNQLNKQIVPFTDSSLPVAPNFFVEFKGPAGSSAVANRQACYYGALGARAMDVLHSYQPAHDQKDNQQQQRQPPTSVSEVCNDAYAVTATYLHGQLTLNSSHSTKPAAVDQQGCQGRPTYIMTPLRSFSVANDIETFCAGAAAYRNARDWAAEAKDEAIARANRRLAEARASRANLELDLVVQEEGQGRIDPVLV